jgi:hypothetical protein
MKNKILLLGLGMLLFSCTGEGDDQPANEPDPVFGNPQNPANPQGGDNNVLLLKVDAVTGAFEGGKQLTFNAAPTFTIATDYVEPGDFGSIRLLYSELDVTFFDVSIHWNGLGQMNYPESLDSAGSFLTINEEVPMPELSEFHKVGLTDGSQGLQSMEPDHEALWDAIDNLELVKHYRQVNPEAKIQLFLYTPSVGIGNPEEWDWFVILKN